MTAAPLLSGRGGGAHWCEVRAAVSILTPAPGSPALGPNTLPVCGGHGDMETWGPGQCMDNVELGHNNKQGSTETTAHQHQAAATPHPGGPASAWFTAALSQHPVLHTHHWRVVRSSSHMFSYTPCTTKAGECRPCGQCSSNPPFGGGATQGVQWLYSTARAVQSVQCTVHWVESQW